MLWTQTTLAHIGAAVIDCGIVAGYDGQFREEKKKLKTNEKQCIPLYAFQSSHFTFVSHFFYKGVQKKQFSGYLSLVFNKELPINLKFGTNTVFCFQVLIEKRLRILQGLFYITFYLKFICFLPIAQTMQMIAFLILVILKLFFFNAHTQSCTSPHSTGDLILVSSVFYYAFLLFMQETQKEYKKWIEMIRKA